MGRSLIWLWAILSSMIALEFYFLHKNPSHSMLFYLQSHHYIKSQFEVSPDPGKPISLYLGYGGFGIMALTNLYIMRKRFSIFEKMGLLKNWLNFHIFCGLMGPTMILFHCDFKVRGLVAISFWSMIVSVSSGVVGRYFYVQISRVKGEYLREAEAYNGKILSYLRQIQVEMPEKELQFYRSRALAVAGAANVPGNPFSAFFSSLAGDVRLMVLSNPYPSVMGVVGQRLFKNYAVSMRKSYTVDSFNRLMGYWHTFHTPFAIFMYIAAILHIIAEIWLGAA